jgi:two-component system response regulator MprA
MHVLVVEDEPSVAHIVNRALEHDHHNVELASDGANGLDLAESDQFDAIVLDVLLPEINGIEVCRRLRAGKVHTPVLMLTARDAVEQRVQGLDAGADDYLTKPFAVAELQARVRALGRRRGETEDEVLTAGALALDAARHEVRLAGMPVELSRREFMLLEYLLRNKGRVLTREQILDNVWGYDFDPGTNVVDIYIHYLRKKLEKGRKSRLFRTVRGVGYSLEAA